MRLLKATILTISMISASVSYAIPIFYDEAVQGDIPREMLSTTFNFGLGGNVITGTASAGPTYGSDFDNFSFVVPNEMQLSSISYSFLLLDSMNGSNLVQIGDFMTLWDRRGDSGYLIGSSDAFNVLIPTPTTSIFKEFLPLASGDYFFTNNLFSGIIGSPASQPGLTALWDYELVFDVTSVPEPFSLLLMMIGLIFLFWRIKSMQDS